MGWMDFTKVREILVTVKNKQGIEFYRGKGFGDYSLILEREI